MLPRLRRAAVMGCALRVLFSSVIAVLKLYAALALIGGVAVGLPLLTNVGPCIIYAVIGLPCPACGLTRAYLYLLTEGISYALFFHPLFFLIPFIPWLAHERLSDKWRNIFSLSVLGLFFIVFIVRMVLFFPDIPPMDYNHNSLLERLIRLVGQLFIA